MLTGREPLIAERDFTQTSNSGGHSDVRINRTNSNTGIVDHEMSDIYYLRTGTGIKRLVEGDSGKHVFWGRGIGDKRATESGSIPHKHKL